MCGGGGFWGGMWLSEKLKNFVFLNRNCIIFGKYFYLLGANLEMGKRTKSQFYGPNQPKIFILGKRFVKYVKIAVNHLKFVFFFWSKSFIWWAQNFWNWVSKISFCTAWADNYTGYLSGQILEGIYPPTSPPSPDFCLCLYLKITRNIFEKCCWFNGSQLAKMKK